LPPEFANAFGAVTPVKFDDVKKLHQKKYRNEFGHYLVEGEHLILELSKAIESATMSSENELTVIQLYVVEKHLEWASQFASKFHIIEISAKQMAQLSDTKTPQGMIACVPFSLHQSLHSSSNQANSRKAVYLHEIQDPGNLGTILRSLAWFGRFTLLLSPNSVDPFNSKVVRSGMGATFHVPVECDVSLAELNQRFERFAYLDMEGQEITHKDFPDYECYVFGNEARGVPRDALEKMKARAFTIRGVSAIESLNLASAVTICSYELGRNHNT
jgi:TrmH family RNA methyltransferase